MFYLELKNATVQYNGTPVLNDLSLQIAEGEKIALVGQSGAGKSTLLNLLYQQSEDDAALVPQDLGLVRSLSVFHNVYMGRLNKHPTWYNIVNLIKPLKKEVDQILPILGQLGLEEKVFEPARELSGGQQQRTAVARAIFKDSSTFFGDEPVSAVDEHQSHTVMEAIAISHRTVVLSMHDVELALKYSSRVIGLKEGELALDEPADRLKAADLDDLYKS
ncbi:MAG: ATP-binding cassette domain-containing protein [Rhodospirillaceae bacterium]|jgi:phosphonate transport system ATP-binding protein|nr:ATP-binding cassette domain-containing protein [Rhodospirillaceae bacterium]MBT4938608.1 ATP-binding cassette domain-containing protein [Rhodospirillaceae bacterium]MBT5941912.1 ATP-binding cassette domain-containing protein [Rhodospirillaceae bacterium]MBT7267962.1 ATP-binding cassette domain-containing protein [Rhodospirillaceae bacterium]